LLGACEKHISVVSKRTIRYQVRIVVLLSSKWVAPIPTGRMVTGSVASSRWRHFQEIRDDVIGEGISVEGAEEADKRQSAEDSWRNNYGCYPLEVTFAMVPGRCRGCSRI
jgi:hypothetical protein